MTKGRKFRCLHCGNEVNMFHVTGFNGGSTLYEGVNKVEIVKRCAIVGSNADLGIIPNAKIEISDEFRVYRCSTCGNVIVFKKSPISPTDKFYEDFQEIKYIENIIYPIVRILDKNIIPEYVSNIYNEACSIKALSPNSFAILIRKALEDICDKHGTKESDKIYEKLESLAKKGIFPQNIIDMGHVIRKISRYGGHPKDEADLLDDIFNLILEYVYVTPYKIKILEEKVERTKKS